MVKTAYTTGSDIRASQTVNGKWKGLLRDKYAACPNLKGDWYNRAFVNYMEGNDARAYG